MSGLLSSNDIVSGLGCTIGDFVLEWRLSSRTGTVVLISGKGTDPQIEVQHPFSNQSVPDGILYPVLQYIYLNGQKYTTDYEEGSLHSPDLLNCFEPVVVIGITTTTSSTSTTTSSSTSTTTTSSTTVQCQEIAELECDGQMQIIESDNNMWVSTDYGATFTVCEPEDTTFWRGIDISGSGQYWFAVTSGTPIGNGYKFVSNDGGTTFTKSANTNKKYGGCCVSETGQYMYTSATQASGYSSSGIERSTDYGQTWSDVSGTSGLYWIMVKCDRTGQYLVAVSNGLDQIYVSTDYGQTFTEVGPSKYYYSCAVDGYGNFYTVDAGDNEDSHYSIRKSTDYGSSWEVLNSSLSMEFDIIAVSATGCHITSVSTDIFVSSDGGSTFEVKHPQSSNSFGKVAMSATGKYQLAQLYSLYTYKSSDYGQTWTQISTPTNNGWLAIQRGYDICTAYPTTSSTTSTSSTSTTTSSTTPEEEQAIIVFGGSSTATRYTTDGSTFVPVNRGAVRDVAYNGSQWLAVNWSMNYSYSLSDNGIDWSYYTSPVDGGYTMGVVWTGQKWVIAGQNTSSGSIYNSTNGIDWTSRYSTSISNTLFNANGTVVVQAGTDLIYSLDHGDSWNTHIYSKPLAYTYGGCYNGSIWVLVGSGASHSIATYNDFTSAGTGRGKTIFTTRGQSVAWNGTMFVAVGEGTNHVAYSYNGIDWTGLGLFANMYVMFDVAWNGTKWYIVGTTDSTSENIWESTDGINWTAVGGDYSSGTGCYAVATKNAPNLYPPRT